MAKSALNRSILAYLMIPKGNQRGGGQQLAAHLQNSYDNDSVELADLRGAIAPDLSGAFAEWFAQAKATKCTKYLYSLSLNPDQRQGKLTRAQYLDFIDRAEKRMGLEDQPRAIVFHVKHGREHCHIVWSRIDTDKMKAVQMSNDHQKLRKIAQEFARDHGIELPEAMKNNRGADRFAEQKKNSDYGEKQQEERSGFPKAERMAAVADAWKSTRTGEEFVRALATKDYYLARGDERDYVVVDLAGEIHSLSRQLKGVKKAELRARLSGMPAEKLPGVEKAQDYARQMREHRRKGAEIEKASEQVTGPTPDERRADLRQQHSLRRLVLDAEREKMDRRHGREAGHLTIEQAKINAGIVTKRHETEQKGVIGFLMNITGIRLVVDLAQKIQDNGRERVQASERTALQQRHDNERKDNERKHRAMERVERRESRSLETAIKREDFQKMIGIDKNRDRGGDGKSRPPDKEPPALTPNQAERLTQMQAMGRALTDKKPPAEKTRRLSPNFNRRAEDRASPSLKPEPQKSEAPPTDAARTEEERESLRAAFESAAQKNETEPEPVKPAAGPTSLAEEFRRRAEKRDRDLDDERDPGSERHFRKQPADYSVRR